MKNSNSCRQQSSGGRRSSSLALNPYFIEDTALTAWEFDRVRSHQVGFIEPR
jgi:hypothetical protein